MKNPFSKSRKFYELIDIYKEIALKGCYYENGDFCPPERVFGKSGQLKFKEVLKKIFDKNKIKTVLDYGGGQGSWVLLDDKGVKLQDYLKLEKVTVFEPARDLNEKPKADCVVSFDVLEHVFFADVPWVLYDIFSKAEKVVIINVAMVKLYVIAIVVIVRIVRRHHHHIIIIIIIIASCHFMTSINNFAILVTQTFR